MRNAIIRAILLTYFMLNGCTAARQRKSAHIRGKEAAEWSHRQTTQPQL